MADAFSEMQRLCRGIELAWADAISEMERLGRGIELGMGEHLQ